MTRDAIHTHTIALLATGDEISNGDILNTNAQEIAQQLFKHGMHIGMHMVTSDTVAEIERAINFLLETHDALIITGGLGPTSDDLTRFALGHAVKKELVFHEECWQAIVERLQRFGYGVPPESNRQQALFPAGATIIPNPHGTAAGCMVIYNAKLIFMLPGPPPECLPMFQQVVLPELKKASFQKVEFHRSWLLFGVSEGHIAEILDQLAKPFDVVTGYRLCYPYIEFKLHSNNEVDFNNLVPQIAQAIAPYLIADGKHYASEILREKISELDFTLRICDKSTGGLLESVLRTPKTNTKLQFTSQADDSLHVQISGLNDFWEHSEATQTILALKISLGDEKKNLETKIPLRGIRVKQYAVEYICWQILLCL